MSGSERLRTTYNDTCFPIKLICSLAFTPEINASASLGPARNSAGTKPGRSRSVMRTKLSSSQEADPSLILGVEVINQGLAIAGQIINLLLIDEGSGDSVELPL